MDKNKTYKVTGTSQHQTLGPNGQPVEKYVVYLTTDRGVTGQVEVSKADWNQAKLAVILQEKADELDLAFTL